MTTLPAGRGRPPLPRLGGRLRPAVPVAGFVVLLALLFTLSYAVGRHAGPVAPGMRPGGGGGVERKGPDEHGGMGGMHSMGVLPVPALALGGR